MKDGTYRRDGGRWFVLHGSDWIPYQRGPSPYFWWDLSTAAGLAIVVVIIILAALWVMSWL